MTRRRYQVTGTRLDEAVTAEFRRLSAYLTNPGVVSLNLAQLNAQPDKFEDGDIVYADGTNWNPGSGEGVYVRYGGAWNYLG